MLITKVTCVGFSGLHFRVLISEVCVILFSSV